MSAGSISMAFRRHALTVCVLARVTCAAAHAEGGGFSLGITGGTLGAGPEVGYRFGERFAARFNAGFFSYDRNEPVDDIDYDGELELDSIGLSFDFHPFGGGFRLSAGVRINNNEIGLSAAPTAPVTVGDVQFDPAEIGTLSGTVQGDDMTPTLTLGYGGKLATGFTLGFEVGVMFQGSPTIENLESTGGVLSGTPQLEAQLRQEEQRIEDEISEFDLWPIAQLVFLWRF